MSWYLPNTSVVLSSFPVRLSLHFPVDFWWTCVVFSISLFLEYFFDVFEETDTFAKKSNRQWKKKMRHSKRRKMKKVEEWLWYRTLQPQIQKDYTETWIKVANKIGKRQPNMQHPMWLQQALLHRWDLQERNTTQKFASPKKTWTPATSNQPTQ